MPSQYPDLPASHAPKVAAPTNHGRTVAAWVLFWLVSAGSVIAAVGFILPSMPWIWVGAIVAAVGVVASVALKFAGLGQAKSEPERAEDDELAHLR